MPCSHRQIPEVNWSVLGHPYSTLSLAPNRHLTWRKNFASFRKTNTRCNGTWEAMDARYLPLVHKRQMIPSTSWLPAR